MHQRSRWPYPFGAVLLVAAGFALQICASSANPLPGSATAPAAISAGSCCDNGSGERCTGLDAAEAADSCARRCAQSSSVLPSQVALSPSSCVPVDSAGVYTEKTAFPPHRPLLAATPPAISSTPLIYHLQRLLN